MTHRGTGRQAPDQRAHGPEVGRLHPPRNAASAGPAAPRRLRGPARGPGVSFPWAEATPSSPAAETALRLLGLSPQDFVLPPTLPVSTGFGDGDHTCGPISPHAPVAFVSPGPQPWAGSCCQELRGRKGNRAVLVLGGGLGRCCALRETGSAELAGRSEDALLGGLLNTLL